MDAAGLDVLLMWCEHSQGVAVSSEFARGLTDSKKQTRETEKRHEAYPSSESHRPPPLPHRNKPSFKGKRQYLHMRHLAG